MAKKKTWTIVFFLLLVLPLAFAIDIQYNKLQSGTEKSQLNFFNGLFYNLPKQTILDGQDYDCSEQMSSGTLEVDNAGIQTLTFTPPNKQWGRITVINSIGTYVYSSFHKFGDTLSINFLSAGKYTYNVFGCNLKTTQNTCIKSNGVIYVNGIKKFSDGCVSGFNTLALCNPASIPLNFNEAYSTTDYTAFVGSSCSTGVSFGSVKIITYPTSVEKGKTFNVKSDVILTNIAESDCTQTFQGCRILFELAPITLISLSGLPIQGVLPLLTPSSSACDLNPYYSSVHQIVKSGDTQTIEFAIKAPNQLGDFIYSVNVHKGCGFNPFLKSDSFKISVTESGDNASTTDSKVYCFDVSKKQCTSRLKNCKTDEIKYTDGNECEKNILQNQTTFPTKLQLSLTEKDLEKSTSTTIMEAVCTKKSQCLPYEDLQGNKDYNVECRSTPQIKQLIKESANEVCKETVTSKVKYLLAGAGVVGSLSCAGAGVLYLLPEPIASKLGAGVLTALCLGSIGTGAGAIGVSSSLQLGCTTFKESEGSGLCIATKKRGVNFFESIGQFVKEQIDIDMEDQTVGIMTTIIGGFIAFLLFR